MNSGMPAFLPYSLIRRLTVHRDIGKNLPDCFANANNPSFSFGSKGCVVRLDPFNRLTTRWLSMILEASRFTSSLTRKPWLKATCSSSLSDSGVAASNASNSELVRLLILNSSCWLPVVCLASSNQSLPSPCYHSHNGTPKGLNGGGLSRFYGELPTAQKLDPSCPLSA